MKTINILLEQSYFKFLAQQSPTIPQSVCMFPSCVTIINSMEHQVQFYWRRKEGGGGEEEEGGRRRRRGRREEEENAFKTDWNHPCAWIKQKAIFRIWSNCNILTYKEKPVFLSSESKILTRQKKNQVLGRIHLWGKAIECWFPSYASWFLSNWSQCLDITIV